MNTEAGREGAEPMGFFWASSPALVFMGSGLFAGAKPRNDGVIQPKPDSPAVSLP